jgi:phosphonate transport system permease protein
VNQFEEIIIEESINICEQLSGYAAMEGEQTACHSISSTEVSLDWGPNNPLKKAIVAIQALLLLGTVLTIYLLFNYKSVNIFKDLADTFVYFKTMYLYPYAQRFTLGDAFSEIGLTLGLAFSTTLIGGIIAVFLGILGSHNLVTERVADICQSLLTLIRAVPTIVWVLIFIWTIGLGSTAVIMGMTVHSISYLSKAYSKSFEDLDRSVIEALMAGGASWWQIVFQAVIPASFSCLLAWTFLRLEINLANALAFGVFAGVGGMSFDPLLASSLYFDLREVGPIAYSMVAFAILLEMGSMNLNLQKRRYP